MPYFLKKVKDGYKVCKRNNSSECFSKKPLSKEKAQKQMTAINISEHKGGAIPLDKDLYEKIKKEVYDKNPKHSAYRSMMITKKYKNAGGKYKEDDNNDMNTKKWLGQKWTSVNDYYHNDEIVECGNTDTQKKFDEYPLCRPLEIVENLSKEDMKKMIDEKNKLGKQPLRTESVLGTDKYNIKNTKTGSTLSGGLKPLTARVGGKVLLKKKIVDNYFPKPDSYNTYVEPFVGGGSIYLYKNKDNHREVISDIDPDIYTMFKGFQKYDAKTLRDDINGDYTKDDFNKIKNSKPSGEYEKFLKVFLLYRLSYFGRGKTFGKPRINSNFEGYKERLSDTTILNRDYKDVIKQFDSKNTFFYLDPPVKESTTAYSYPAINIDDLAKTVKKIKGKFLLSLADTKVKKELFKGFKIITIPTKYVGEKTKGGQTKKVNEYLIMNYEPRMEGSGTTVEGENVVIPKDEFIQEHEKLIDFFKEEVKDQSKELQTVKGGRCGGCLGKCGGEISKFHKKLDEIGLSPEKYLNKAKELAEATGYDPSKILFCDSDTNKLMYDSPNGMKHFGHPDYSDYIIWSWLEHKGEVPKGTADERRRLYRARATNIKGDWKKDKYSPNNLAINILW